MSRRRWAAAAALAGVACATLLAGCADASYCWQSASGHLNLMRAARPVPQWLQDPSTSAALKAKLELTQRIRRFAVTELGLPDNASYTRYADLHRAAAVWNVVAAPPYSLTLKTWCFPIVGCVGYRGYYDEAAAKAEAAAQTTQGLEAVVYPVPAYSTLGWMNWLGGDPLLSTFIGYPEGELARIVFHELAHQVLYVPGDTVFNESYATAVERIGGARWLRTQAGEAARAEYAQFDAQRQQFRALAADTRRVLSGIYDSREAKAQDWPAVEARKKAAMDAFRRRYAALRAAWTGPRQGAYDGWVARANNALFGAQAAYDDLVPAFEALFEHEDENWPRFYAEVKRLAALPQDERVPALKAETAAASTAARPAPDSDNHNNHGGPGA
ncbi:aminopeptidase [Variovorax sp. PBL-E5]|uniref:aminopeptidase n=1 Tax=Variovorax sp. PBL-E5 TaxID=434014 RepID=UPI0013163050|nr:aminopeptidase [Variovorax sp. PBL-E5]VTU18833.1 putative aminopeptidase [Variovorax sp. PBL-E5]